jgi:membrane protein implicated in regulation of membrane protease activity
LTSGETVGVFSRDRWGVGSVSIIGGLTALGFILLYVWLTRHSITAASVASVLLFGAGVLFTVKVSEEIQRVRRGMAGPVGETGVVVEEVRAGAAEGIVKVGGELWSATSESRIEVGASVLVVGRKGLRLIVERTEGGAPNRS